MFNRRTQNSPKYIYALLLQCSEDDGYAFLSRIITGEESRVHHYDPLTKRQSMELHHQSSPRKKKFKVQTSAGNVMASLFWDSEGILLVEILERGVTINSERYVQTEVKTTNSKRSAEKENESSLPPA
jgi:hypothetical protein